VESCPFEKDVDSFTVYRNMLWVYEADSLGPLVPPHVTMSIGTRSLYFGLTFDFIKTDQWTDRTLIPSSPSFSLQTSEQIIHKKYLASFCTQSLWCVKWMLLQPRVHNVHRIVKTTETTASCLDNNKEILTYRSESTCVPQIRYKGWSS